MPKATIPLRLHLRGLDPQGIGRARVTLGPVLIAAYDTTRAEFRVALFLLNRRRVPARLAALARAEEARRQSLGRTYHWVAKPPSAAVARS